MMRGYRLDQCGPTLFYSGPSEAENFFCGPPLKFSDSRIIYGHVWNIGDAWQPYGNHADHCNYSRAKIGPRACSWTTAIGRQHGLAEQDVSHNQGVVSLISPLVLHCCAL